MNMKMKAWSYVPRSHLTHTPATVSVYESYRNSLIETDHHDRESLSYSQRRALSAVRTESIKTSLLADGRRVTQQLRFAGVYCHLKGLGQYGHKGSTRGLHTGCGLRVGRWRCTQHGMEQSMHQTWQKRRLPRGSLTLIDPLLTRCMISVEAAVAFRHQAWRCNWVRLWNSIGCDEFLLCIQIRAI